MTWRHHVQYGFVEENKDKIDFGDTQVIPVKRIRFGLQNIGVKYSTKGLFINT